MHDPIRWGILGAANFALTDMAPAIHGAAGSVLAALATRSEAKADPFRALAPGLRVFDDYDALLADPEIDAVYVPLPNALHVEWTKKALHAGKHVLTEKPIAMVASEIDELIALRDQTGLLAAEAYMIVHHAQWQRAKALLAEGAIGDLVHVHGLFSYDNSSDPANIRNSADAGGGGLRDIGVYPFGAARFATGEEPRDIAARVIYESGVDVVANVTAEFPSFSFASTVSMRAAPFQEMTFHGREAVMRLAVPFNANKAGEARIDIFTPGAIRTERFPNDHQYRNQVEAFTRAIREDLAYPCPLEFSRGTQVMLDEIFRLSPPPA